MPLAIGVILLFAFLYLIKKDKGAPGAAEKAKIQPNGKKCPKFPNSKGLRNNNPGNIRLTNETWQGKIPNAQNTDGSFEQFQTWIWGVRAMTVLVRNHIKAGHNTISKLINKYAPPIENDTNRYVGFVADKTNILPNAKLDYTDKTVMRKLIKAMVAMELGCDLVTDSEFNKAWDAI